MILAIQAAKLKGGSWEKAEAVELISTQVPGEHGDARFDRCLIRRFRQAWHLQGSGQSGTIGFGKFFSMAAASLVSALGRRHSTCPFGSQIARLRRILHESYLQEGCAAWAILLPMFFLCRPSLRRAPSSQILSMWLRQHARVGWMVPTWRRRLLI